MKKEHVYGALCFFLIVLSLCAIFATVYFCRPSIKVTTSYGEYEQRVPSVRSGAAKTLDYFEALKEEKAKHGYY